MSFQQDDDQICYQTKLVINEEQETSLCICSICQNIFKDPKACSNCLNHFCQKCIVKCQQELPEQCPLCKKYKEIRAAPLLKTLLSKLKFICTFKEIGCQQIIPYDNFIAHVKNCQYRTVKCCYQGCNYKGIKKQIKTHSLQCQFLLTKCNYCFNNIQMRHMKYHLTYCPEKIVQCFSCIQQIKQHLMENHIENCPLRVIICNYCSHSFIKSQIDKHIQQCDQRKVECIGCKKNFLLEKLFDHRRKCAKCPKICEHCKQILPMDSGKSHTINECSQKISREIEKELCFLREQNQGLMKEIRVNLKKLSFKLKEKKLQFCKINHNNGIYVDGSFAAVREYKKKIIPRFALFKTKPLQDQPFSCKLYFNSLKYQLTSVGITDILNLCFDRNLSNINHGSYLVTCKGMVFSSHDVHTNLGVTDFRFQVNDIILLVYQKGRLQVVNASKNMELRLELPEKLKDSYPCVCMYSAGERVSIKQ